ncbi:hypothetical protein [Bacillus cereus]|nr:hypothetical protein [Bacillus cereus]MCU4794627.1 hypothetical protein [Bacillus cereus]MCU5437564.1 hypothetical protein [Bacillus cereus]
MTKVKGDLLEKIQTFITTSPYEVQEVTKAENQLNQLIENATK